MTKIQKGLPVKDRKLATTVRPEAKKGKLTANQWQNTPQQNMCMELWLDPTSKTFGNIYQSALKAGYTHHYARHIASNAVGNKWIKEYVRKASLEPIHVIQGIQRLALEGKEDIQLRAYEMLGKLQGMFIDKSISVVDVRFTNAVPRPTRVDNTTKPPKTQ